MQEYKSEHNCLKTSLKSSEAMTGDPLVSILIPVYNVGQYIAQCLESVIHQTYRNLEIIIVDDGSTDDSGIICERYAGRDDRIQVFHTSNKGLAAARNLGLDHAKGPIFRLLTAMTGLKSKLLRHF